MLIFAYGSNMCRPRMRQRVPSAEIVDVGAIAGFDLRFHKRSVDGSGKADAFATGDDTHVVWGVTWRIDPVHKPILDECESLGVGYDCETVTVRSQAQGRLEALAYLARPEVLDPVLRPYHWYKQLVVTGAAQHALPDEYVALLHMVASIDDPERQRHEQHVRLLCDLR
ncbi:hypothetical protein Mal4_08100 [Maioricimonas rarisocia]|uniref:AIG2-like family protein n=1 Tax=Maioricimonas rarisocia TaxID=2528026 RepID=A0A517Z211_9PLAN|nr:gamma-glutamylcyclotransferase family protein [Maioricimonas rarisocia]QDU36524.1 hypothetical protein Mal4_08100 [Maioricimonas rarisocia]